MSILTVQQWQAIKRVHSPCLVAAVLITLTACGNMQLAPTTAESDASFEVAPPPNFTRGLLARRTAEPLYPLRAKTLGIEGWVLLRFSVDEDGSVISNSIQTLEEQPAGYFRSSSITAARRLTFENTRGSTVEDVRYVFRYQLEEVNRVLAQSPSQEIQFRELIPTRFITPRYPPGVEQQGIEGYVVVQFTVTDSGSVQDIVINESEPLGIFDNEALAAAARLRFEPRIIFDAPVVVEKVLFRFDWHLPR